MQPAGQMHCRRRGQVHRRLGARLQLLGVMHGPWSVQLRAGACTAASDADCKSSQDCQKQQTCEAYRGSCVDLAKSVHAERVNRCETDGLCVMSGGKCAALSRLHCAGTMDAKPEPTSPCATQGRCNAENGRCTAASNEDCARS